MKVSFWSQSFSTVAREFFCLFKRQVNWISKCGISIIMDCLLWLCFVFNRSVVIESSESFKFASLKVAIISLLRFLWYYNNTRDFKIRYGEVLLRLRESNSLPVMSAHALQYGFLEVAAVACFTTSTKYFVWRSLHYVSINFHFLAIFISQVLTLSTQS